MKNLVRFSFLFCLVVLPCMASARGPMFTHGNHFKIKEFAGIRFSVALQ